MCTSWGIWAWKFTNLLGPLISTLLSSLLDSLLLSFCLKTFHILHVIQPSPVFPKGSRWFIQAIEGNKRGLPHCFSLGRGVRPGRTLYASNLSQVHHCCRMLLSPAKPSWRSVISWYCKVTDIDRACEDALGKTHQTTTLSCLYLAPPLSYANHTWQTHQESIKSLCPGLPVTEMEHRKNDKSSCS